jgi:hypothetical protein
MARRMLRLMSETRLYQTRMTVSSPAQTHAIHLHNLSVQTIYRVRGYSRQLDQAQSKIFQSKPGAMHPKKADLEQAERANQDGRTEWNISNSLKGPPGDDRASKRSCSHCFDPSSMPPSIWGQANSDCPRTVPGSSTHSAPLNYQA